MHGDPVVISTNTRSKLNAFRYADCPESAMSIPVMDKDTAVSKELEVPAYEVVQGTTNTENENLQTQNSGPKNCPQTPAHRIPLADLISNTEDAFSRVPGKTMTPDDHVYWDHGSSDSKGVSPIPRRKKRPRSSSPASSPLNPDAKNPLQPSEAPRKIIKTPQHDVAADLWTKYVGKNNGTVGDNVPKIHFSQLVSSSPQTPVPIGRIGRDTSGLRRTNSCFVDWPTSHSKRRKLDNESQVRRIRDGFARSKSSILEPGKSKSSKIGMLVEKIQESLLKRSREDHGPSSSSPLPERSEYMHDYPATPPKDVDGEVRPETPSKSPSKSSRPDPPMALDDITEDLASKILSSDFGDDDLDNDFLELAVDPPDDCQPEQQQADEDQVTVESFDADNALIVDIAEEAQNEQQPQTNRIPAHNDRDVDEFDDGEDDFPDGMEEILAQFDDFESSPAGQVDMVKVTPAERQTTIPHIKNGYMKTGQGPVDCLDGVDDDDDDEFDDDGIDLAAIEQSVLQNVNSHASITSQVRRPLCL